MCVNGGGEDQTRGAVDDRHYPHGGDDLLGAALCADLVSLHGVTDRYVPVDIMTDVCQWWW
jgi:hypothetical protein